MVDIYKYYSKDLYYYDINSLYPSVILKLMSFDYLSVNKGDNLDKKSFWIC